MKSRSQAWQDVFVYNLLGDNGTYIEVGSHKPVKLSNTYNLEVFHNWKGFGIEFNTALKQFWDDNEERKNKVYWDNALTFDYVSALTENKLPLHISYLSCDIEPPENTFSALQRIVEQGITFDCITFEHDLYQSKTDFNAISKDFLISHGYKVGVTDVYYKTPNLHFETWFVRNDIDFETCTFDQWMKNNL
jgi:hypothetical protein